MNESALFGSEIKELINRLDMSKEELRIKILAISGFMASIQQMPNEPSSTDRQEAIDYLEIIFT